MSNRILLLSGNFYPEPTGIGKYSGEMVDWLSENGFSCTVVTTFPYYPDWKVQGNYRMRRFWFKQELKKSENPEALPVTIIRCPHYIPTRPTAFKRVLSEITISFSSYLAVIFVLFKRKFDYVHTIAPPFILGLLGVFYKKLRNSTFIYHIQDLQIDAARELEMVSSKKALHVLSSIEKYIMNAADHISTISEGMVLKIRAKIEKDIILCPNWVDTTVFSPVNNQKTLRSRFGFLPTDKIVMYSGAIGVKQGLESFVLAAKAFSKYENVKFIICGNGPYKGHLLRLRDEIQATNLFFLPLQKLEDFNSFLNIANVHLVIQKANASDLMLPSKLGTILAVGGVVIVTANPGTSLYNIIHNENVGLAIEPENQSALNSSIQLLLDSENLELKMRARAYAEEYLAKDKVLPGYINKVINHSNDKNKGLVKSRLSLSQ